MTSRTLMKWLTVMLALGLIVNACGSSGDSDEAESESEGNLIDEDTKEATQEAVLGPVTSVAEINTIEDYEALWASERAAIVEQITSNGWGWDQEANTITGPGGFEVDLASCPEGWDPYGGLENGTILIGQTLAQSGTLADYGNIGVAQQVYYDYINSQGGITDSEGKTYSIVTDRRDDTYDPAKTVPLATSST